MHVGHYCMLVCTIKRKKNIVYIFLSLWFSIGHAQFQQPTEISLSYDTGKSMIYEICLSNRFKAKKKLDLGLDILCQLPECCPLKWFWGSGIDYCAEFEHI